MLRCEDDSSDAANCRAESTIPVMPLSDAPSSAFRHWLATVNISLTLYVAGGFAAPVLAAGGLRSLADALYAVYHLTCHQWAFRSFFLLGSDTRGPLAAYTQDQLAALPVDPFGFVGDPELGWKMAFCERDLAIYAALLAVGLFYAKYRSRMQPLGFGVYAVLILPIALDGFTQLFGWRESTWQLRVATGALFGLASAWLVLPRLDASFGLLPSLRQYSPDARCEPAPAIPAVPALATVEPYPAPLTEPAQSQTPPRHQLSPGG